MKINMKIFHTDRIFFIISTFLLFLNETVYTLTISLIISCYIFMHTLSNKDAVTVALITTNIFMHKYIQESSHIHLMTWCFILARIIKPNNCCIKYNTYISYISLFISGVWSIYTFISGFGLERSIIKGCTLFCSMCPCPFIIGRPLISRYIYTGRLTETEGRSILRLLDIWGIIYNSIMIIINIFGEWMGFELTPGTSSFIMVHSTGVTYYIMWAKVRSRDIQKERGKK
ncbi:hypothetical protein NERG_02511 [Nematocida ausubeli]|uniref:Uncharacterized protein n=1 Tax=Nematocida ausubeli (strain ATCC PRA-371 / ERTm2) TaxID=1913371 RepID=H8ZFZ0_NEMA1|nr:hypothetical protein NERG_02511 [Nematocida ausubeli]